MTFDPTQREPSVPPTPAATPPAPVIPGPVTTAPIGAAPTAKGSSSGRWLNVILAGALLFAVGGNRVRDRPDDRAGHHGPGQRALRQLGSSPSAVALPRSGTAGRAARVGASSAVATA